MTDKELIEKIEEAIREEVYDPRNDNPRKIARVALAVFRKHTAPATDEAAAWVDDDLYGVIDRAMQRSWTDATEYEYAPSEITAAVRTWMDEQCFRRGAPAEPTVTPRYPGETEPIAKDPVLRGVDLAMDWLVRQDCFTERTLRILDELRAEVIGGDKLRAQYAALEERGKP